MSVLIKGMEMPDKKNGAILIFYPDGKVCYEDGTEFEAVELPPHGDLIDRNKLYEKTAEWEAQALHMLAVHMNDEDTAEWRKWSTVVTERSGFKYDVADAPTIIEAEGEE